MPLSAEDRRVDADCDSDGLDSAAAQALAERLHDGPLQLLAALSLRLTALANRGSADSGDLGELKGLTAGVIGELNKLVYELAAGPAGEAQPRATIDLGERLAKLCQGFKLSSGIECRLHLQAEHTRLSAQVSVIVLRTIRELLTNVRRHAHARRVEVTSAIREDGSLIFAVKDDGIGIVTPDRLRPFENRGFGLWSIDQRLREVDGYMQFENDSGLTATIVLPGRLLKVE
jgi:signal transduction histidine kinase